MACEKAQQQERVGFAPYPYETADADPWWNEAYALSEWSMDVRLAPDALVRLFGVTEDITCEDQGAHTPERTCRLLCRACRVPVCRECQIGLHAYNPERKQSSVPMSLANDHMYGYVAKMVAEQHVTWMECAAASLVWSTILVYYLEAPYGHLMQEKMDGPEARTMARGNLFSFSLPWEEIEALCKEATAN